MADRTGDPTVVTHRTAAPMVDRTEDPIWYDRMAHPMVDLAAVHIVAIGSAAGPAGSMDIATSGIASGIAGIRTATTVQAGTFAELTGSHRDELASGAPSNPSVQSLACRSIRKKERQWVIKLAGAQATHQLLVG
jgi:hypothetical protein